MINTIVQEKSVKISSKKIKEKEEEEEKEDVSEWWGYEIIYIRASTRLAALFRG